MSDVCGIFYKSCPQCAMAVAKSAAACHCGYSFEDETSASALAQSLSEEKLYEDYLSARVAQTAQAAIDAQAAAQKRQPADAALCAAARAAMEVAEAARQELAAQSARVEQLRQEIAAETTGNVAATRAFVEPISAPAALNDMADAPAQASSKPAQASARAAEVARAAEALRIELAKLRQPDETTDDCALTPARALPPAGCEPRSDRRPAHGGVAARNDTVTDIASSEMHAQAAVAPANPTAKKRCPQCDAALIVSANRCRCGFVFVAQAAATNVPKIEDVLARAQELKQARRESTQAQKAARIQEARLARAAAKSVAARPDRIAASDAVRGTEDAAQAQSAPGTEPVTAVSPPAAALRAVDSALPASPSRPPRAVAPTEQQIRPLAACLSPARPLVAGARDVKECSNCTANVAAHVSRCKCGFEFRDLAATSPMPALRLDEGEALKVRALYIRR